MSVSQKERRGLKGGVYRDAPQGDPLAPLCQIYSILGNIWRLKTYRYLCAHSKEPASPVDIFTAIGAPSYFIVQWSLRILADGGLVEHRARSGTRSYFGLTPKGVWVADMLSQLDELMVL